ncbi:MAG TPA: hypothetical protein VHQ47_15975 [Phycisphaerae bacterium]|nr:hypothetical protein [Phycisphaerae bacterium]
MGTNDYPDPVDDLIAQRLSRLASRPVDTTRLDKKIRAGIPSADSRWRRVARPLTAVAAALIVLIAASALLFSSRPALASAADMIQMHRDMVSGRIATMKVDSIGEANKAIAAMVGNFPQLSEPPETHTMACCMRNVGNKQVACVLLNDGATPVTMTVARTQDVRTPSTAPITHDGQLYYVQSFDNLNMVMFNRRQHWICLIGALSPEKLMDLSSGFKFSPAP